MKRIVFWIAAVLPLAAQPKLLINAQVDQRSASGGLETQFQSLLAATPQPAWIGYTVPAVRTYSLGCEFVSHNGWSAPGVIHLEPPDQVVVLFRIANNAVERVRALSPNCEIDAGGVPVHWMNDVKPAESVALLAGFAERQNLSNNSSVSAIAMHADSSADAALDKFAAAGQPQNLRLRAVRLLGSARGAHGFEVVKGLLASDADERIRQAAISAMGSSKLPEAIDLLIASARNEPNTRLRSQAVSELGHKEGAKVIPTLSTVIATDLNVQVQRRAVGALRSIPDGQGVPVLIDLAKNTKSAEIRKQAMSALSQTQDPRAVAFFETVLR